MRLSALRFFAEPVVLHLEHFDKTTRHTTTPMRIERCRRPRRVSRAGSARLCLAQKISNDANFFLRYHFTHLYSYLNTLNKVGQALIVSVRGDAAPARKGARSEE